MKNFAYVAAALLSTSALAVPVVQNYTVGAKANSANNSAGSVVNGVALPTASFTLGQALTISVASTDIWAAGPLTGLGAGLFWSNADGLIVNRFATGTDESGATAGTQIGAVFPLYTLAGFTAPYGSLVGRIGSNYRLIGTGSGITTAWATGLLELFYWDVNGADNLDSVNVRLAFEAADVPEPSALALLGLGLAGVGFARRRKA